jgi:hypothetical protein
MINSKHERVEITSMEDINYHLSLQLVKQKMKTYPLNLFKNSSFERSTIDLVISRPQKTLHSSNKFFAQILALLTF